jgi:hypothetical protein
MLCTPISQDWSHLFGPVYLERDYMGIRAQFQRCIRCDARFVTCDGIRLPIANANDLPYRIGP